jgi:hypothetical protein
MSISTSTGIPILRTRVSIATSTSSSSRSAGKEIEVNGSTTRVTARASPTGITRRRRNLTEGLMPRPPSRGKPIADGQKVAVRNWRETGEVSVAAKAVPGIEVDREVGRADLATVGASGLEEVWAIDPLGIGTPRRLMAWAGEAMFGARAPEAPQAVEERPEQEGAVAPAVAGAGKALR